MSTMKDDGKKTYKELILEISSDLKLRTLNLKNKQAKNHNMLNRKVNYSPIGKNTKPAHAGEENKKFNKAMNNSNKMKLSLLFYGFQLDYSKMMLKGNKTNIKAEYNYSSSLDNQTKPFELTKNNRRNKTDTINTPIETIMNNADELTAACRGNDEVYMKNNKLKTTSPFISCPMNDTKKEKEKDKDKDIENNQEIPLAKSDINNNKDINRLLLKNPLILSFDKKQKEKVNEYPVPLTKEIKPEELLSVEQTDKTEDEYINKSENELKIKKSISQFKKTVNIIDSYSHVGYAGPNIEKHNQDSSCIIPNFLEGYEENESYFLSVCDGHGINGDLISNYIVDILPKELKANLSNAEDIMNKTDERDKIINDTFINVNNQLGNNYKINSMQSGTTCCSLILTPNSVISCNLGDSRAVLGRYANNKWSAIDITSDHKPDNPIEKERIISMGGRVEPFMDEYAQPSGPYRIWMQNEEFPGLAMSRSFGDQVAASIGAISEPEIKEFKLTAFDKILIIASDGIWEFITTSECIEMMSEFYFRNDIKGALEYMYQEAKNRWIKEDEDVIDDITSIIVFFN